MKSIQTWFAQFVNSLLLILLNAYLVNILFATSAPSRTILFARNSLAKMSLQNSLVKSTSCTELCSISLNSDVQTTDLAVTKFFVMIKLINIWRKFVKFVTNIVRMDAQITKYLFNKCQSILKNVHLKRYSASAKKI